MIIVKIIKVILFMKLFLICVCCKVERMLCFNLGVLIIEVIIIIDRVSMVVWLILVIIVFLVKGNFNLNNFC